MGYSNSIMGQLCHNYYIMLSDYKLVQKMMFKCKDCDADINIPEDVEEGEIIGCADCGLDFIIKNENGSFTIQELAIEGEDWGE